MNSNILKLDNLLVKRSDSFSLKIAELHIKANSIIGLVGNNGSGKTTLLMSLLDILELSEGTIELFGKKWNKQEVYIKRDIGVYLDETYLIDYLSLHEYFHLLSKAFNYTKETFLERAKVYMEILNIKTTDNQLIRELSRGNQIKIGLIGSLLHQPKLVLWDEPFANLDPISRIGLIELILKLKKENDSSFIISSHNIDELYEFSDYFLCLKNGLVAAMGERNRYTKNAILNYLDIGIKA